MHVYYLLNTQVIMVDSSLIILLHSVPGPKQKKKKEKDELKIEEEAKTSDSAEEKLVKNSRPPPTIPGRFSPSSVHLRNWHLFVIRLSCY